jgi:hypothetical protein
MRWDVKVIADSKKEALELFKRDMDSVESTLKSEAEDAAKAAREVAKQVAKDAREAPSGTPTPAVVEPTPVPKGGYFPLKEGIVKLTELMMGEHNQDEPFSLHSYGEHGVNGGGTVTLKVNQT